MPNSDDLPTDLSPQELRARKVIELLLSPPVVSVFGGGSVCYAMVGLPGAVATDDWMLATFNFGELVVGSLCLVLPGVETLCRSCRSGETCFRIVGQFFNKVGNRIKRIFPTL